MKFFAMTIIGILLSSLAMAQNEREFDFKNLEALGIKITGIQFTTNENKCDVKYYSPFDATQNGVLDSVCVGLKYDVCDPEGESKAYFKFQQDGGVCQGEPDRTQCVQPGELTTGAPLCVEG
jgi:hypothetical protein|tara:strand:- start:76 stop:441 length:366 start_codon:yes stop_codon:yes gene_type:complete